MAKVTAEGETIYTLVLSEKEALDLAAWVGVHNPTNTGLSLFDIYASLTDVLREQGHPRSTWTNKNFNVTITHHPY